MVEKFQNSFLPYTKIDNVAKEILSNDNFFIPFKASIEQYSLPKRFNYPFDYEPHPLSVLAAKELQDYLLTQQDFEHNFGVIEGKKGAVIGKMFGVLVVKNEQGEIGYLAAFSGKLAGVNTHIKFVPAVYDSLTEGSFLNVGMQELNRMNRRVEILEALNNEEHKTEIEQLKINRKLHSNGLQEKLFDHYHFLNQNRVEKSLRDIFEPLGKRLPAGAGECAAPKLLQYAFQQNMQALTIAEFWWGINSRAVTRKHKEFYPVCLDKCKPILGHMLEGIEMDEKPN